MKLVPLKYVFGGEITGFRVLLTQPAQVTADLVECLKDFITKKENSQKDKLKVEQRSQVLENIA